MRKSWRTTLSGLISSAAALVVAVPDIVNYNPAAMKAAAFVLAGGLATMGIVSRDNNKTDEQSGAGKK